MVVGYFFLVLQYLAVELIHHQINRGIHVRIAGFDVDIFALQVNADFGFLFQLVHGQRDANSNNVVNVAGNTFQLGFDVFAQCGGDIKMNAGDFQVQTLLLIGKALTPWSGTRSRALLCP